MIKIINPRKVVLGNGMMILKKIPDNFVEAIVYNTLLKYGIICDDIIVNSKA